MPDFWGTRDTLSRDRELFLGGESAVTGLRAPILSSWRRCASMGLSPETIEPPYHADLDMDSRLIRAAAPVLDRLESEVAGARMGVVLADRHGVILHCRADEKALYRRFEVVRLAPGFTYSEEYVGTHGIATALEERQDFRVFGAEHFANSLRPFVSLGAVVRDPLSGSLEGVVGLTSGCADANPAMASRVRKAAEAIALRLLEQRTERERALLQEALQVERRVQVAMADMTQTPPGPYGPPVSSLTDSDRKVLREKATELISAAPDTAVRVPLSGDRVAALVCRPVAGALGEEGVAVRLSFVGDAPGHRPVTVPDGTGSASTGGTRADGAPTAMLSPPTPDGPREAAPPAQAAGEESPGHEEPADGDVPGVPVDRAPTGQGPAEGAVTDAPVEWLLAVGQPEMGRLAMAARERLELLYDASIRIGTTLDVTRTAEELAEVVVPRFADIVTVDLLEPVLRGDEALVPDTPLQRAALGAHHADPPFRPAGKRISFASSAPQARCFAEGLAVLEPDVRAVPEWLAQDPGRVQQLVEYGIHSLIAVPLRTRRVTLGLTTFYRCRDSRPFEEDDLHLAEELIARVAICVDNARRFTREQTVALTLQRSLLPGVLPEQTAVEVAHRYLPAQIAVGGVGGDWFDVIPLSGARVALVVGDVVGHGLHAAVTMGRLRTAVHNFATLDLAPDELLGRLDDLVITLGQEGTLRPGGDYIIGATCLYAVYDPVSQRCTVARAGHPPPAVVDPDGAVHFPDLPAGPPLGLGGLPFESAELQLPEGSQLVLYTDGLIEDRDLDIDVALERLRAALSHADRAPEQTCESVLRVLPGPGSTDDVTLLVARTRALSADHTACWDVPTDPAAISAVREAAVRQLTAWGLEDCAFTTELVLSELATNAIRHATGPVQVRLLRDRVLICEVSDGSSTSPHLRQAAATDEGGRGLFLVAQLAQRWGTRYTPRGKVIWAEQPLSPTPAPLELSSW
ncbi:SpoIIE family protein phosphatase [Streptomyces dysideae]|uniref:Protein phosphatase n=1 Tax=Streptomyces dysideae TaxID=909626 RepID=A0A101V071_9ACTN|nr:SpoIIE family protein phosphatase [Streptomyces dysideae]KUO20054.1 protein phosphatase [Streptomyces dysideae]